MKSTTIKPFNGQSEFTIFNNYILDYVMPKTSPNGWKCLCFIIRKTKGWHKLSDNLSFSQIKDGTGIKSDPTVSAALKELEESKFILVQRHSGQWDSNTYTLNTTLEIKVEEKDSTIESIAVSTIESIAVSTIDSIDTKETLKEKEIKRERQKRPPTISAIQIFVEVTGKYCLNNTQIKVISERVGTTQESLDKWRDCVIAWQLCGYKLTNITGMLEWFDKGIPQYRNGANNNNGKYQNYFRQNESAQPTGEELANQRSVDIYTNEWVYPDGRREPVS